jgi:tRNA(adenine34) deaminase
MDEPSQIFVPDDAHYLRQAFRQAELAFEAQEVPIGCVITDARGRVVGKGYNQVERLKDPTAHAEILAITAACQTLENWRLEGCTLYVTLEPCPMCAGAILNSRIDRVVYAAADQRFGACGTRSDVLTGNALNRLIKVEGGLMSEDSIALIRLFFQEMRARKGDSGKKSVSLDL